MSVEAMAIVLHHSNGYGLTNTDRIVLLGIANHAGDGGSWPTIATLAKYAECSRSTVQRSVHTLQSVGLVRVVLNGGGDRNWRDDQRPNQYFLQLECPSNCDHSMNHRVKDSVETQSESVENSPEPVETPADNGVSSMRPRTQNGVSFSVNGVSSVHERGVIGDTQTIQEPSSNKPPTLPSSASDLLMLIPSPVGDEPVDSFDDWWTLYPRKVGKKAARRAFTAAMKQHPRLDLIDALRPHITALAAANGRGFCPHAATWLNGERWTDPVESSGYTMSEGAQKIWQELYG